MKAYHFVGETLRDGRPVPADGVWLEHDGPCVMCKSGLHASLDPFDALKYAPGNILCLVDVEDIANQDKNKLVCRRRKIIRRVDATDLLRRFTRLVALDVIHLWNPPDVVRQYLLTGDERIREEARKAAAYAADASYAAADAAADASYAAYAAAAASYAAADAAARSLVESKYCSWFKFMVDQEMEEK